MITEDLLIPKLLFPQKLIDTPRDGKFSYRRLCEKRKPSTTLIRFQNNTYGSKVVWGYAIAWDLVEVARELKVAAYEVSH